MFQNKATHHTLGEKKKRQKQSQMAF